MELHPTKREPPPLGCRSSRSAFFAGDLELPVLLTLTTALGAQEEAAAAALMVPPADVDKAVSVGPIVKAGVHRSWREAPRLGSRGQPGLAAWMRRLSGAVDLTPRWQWGARRSGRGARAES